MIGEIIIGPDSTDTYIEIFLLMSGLEVNRDHSIRIHTYGDLSDWDGFDEDNGGNTGLFFICSVLVTSTTAHFKELITTRIILIIMHFLLKLMFVILVILET